MRNAMNISVPFFFPVVVPFGNGRVMYFDDF